MRVSAFLTKAGIFFYDEDGCSVGVMFRRTWQETDTEG